MRSKRRYNKTGTIHKLSGNRTKPYRALSPFLQIEGKRKRVTVGYYIKYKEAEENLDRWIKEHPIVSDFVIGPDCTLEELYNVWLGYMSKGKRSRQTKDNYTAAWKHISIIKDVPLLLLRTKDYKSVISSMQDKGLSWSSLHKAKVLMGMLENFAFENDILYKKYSQFVEIPQKEQSKKEAIKHDQIKKIEKLAKAGDRTAQITVILIYTGWRIGELLSMELDGYNQEEQLMTGGSKTESGKNRIVPVIPHIQPYVEAFAAEKGTYLINRMQETCKGNNQKKGYVRLTENYFRRYMFGEMMKSLDIYDSEGEEYTPHNTRHTFVSLCKKAEIDEYYVKEIVGHSHGNNVTDAVYTHTDIDMLRKAIMKINPTEEQDK